MYKILYYYLFLPRGKNYALIWSRFMMFNYKEVEKMFFDPTDLVISTANKYLSKIKVINSIFS